MPGTDISAALTEATKNGDLDKIVLAPGVNEYGGGVNADGVYYINTGGNDLAIKNSRIHGTLLIDVGSDKSVYISDECFIHPYRDDFPTLIIKAETVELKVISNGGSDRLDEGDKGHNFNPSGAPYEGQTDGDQNDSYPSEIRGLVHVIGDVSFPDQVLTRVHGVLVVDGELNVDKPCEFIHDRSLMTNPPLGYTDDPTSTDMIIEAQSWTCQPAP